MKKVLLATIVIVSICSYAHAQTKNFIDQPYVEVNASADTAVTPDEIYIQFTISEADTKGKVSLEEQERKMASALKNIGINTDKDLSVSDMNSNFKTYFLRSKDVLKSRDYVVKVNNALTAGRVFAALEDLSIANASVQKVVYSHQDALMDILRAKAVQKAKKTAEALTKPLKQYVSEAINITDFGGGAQNTSTRLVLFKAARTLDENAVSQPNIDFEKIKFNASVNVKFILR